MERKSSVDIYMNINFSNSFLLILALSLPEVDVDYLYFFFVSGSICLSLAFGMHYGKRITEFKVAILFNIIVLMITIVFFVKFTFVGVLINNLMGLK